MGIHSKNSGTDPYGNFNFRVNFMHPKLGHIKSGFNKVSPIGVTGVYKEYREGGNNKMPDLILESVSAEPVTLTKGMTDNDAIEYIANMFFSSKNGVVSSFQNRFDVEVEVMDRQNKRAVKTYQMLDCVIEQFILGEFDSLGETYAIENIVFRFGALTTR